MLLPFRRPQLIIEEQRLQLYRKLNYIDRMLEFSSILPSEEVRQMRATRAILVVKINSLAANEQISVSEILNG